MDSILLVDPRTDIKSHTAKEHIIVSGASRVTEYQQLSNSYSDSQVSWSFQPPSTKIIVGRKFMLRCKLKFTSTSGDFDIGLTDGPRQFPLASIMETLDVKLNGGSISDAVGDRVHAMLAYNNDAQKRTNCWTQSPSMPDNYQEYSDWFAYGSGKNPLAHYGENSLEDTRGGFPTDAETATTATYTFTEPLLMSPFLTGAEGEDEGFVNINQIDIQIRWVANLARAWCHDNRLPGSTGVTVTFESAPELLVQYFTPDMSQPIPSLQVLPHVKHNDYIKPVNGGTAVTAGASINNALTDTIKLNQVPRKVMIFARHARNSMAYDVSDSFARIDKISLLWNNESNLLSSATTQDLHRISRRNGCNISWSQWNKYRGSVFVAEFGSDIGLSQGLSPGVLGQFTISAQVGLTNVGTVDRQFELYMCTMLDGAVEISENSLAVSLGNLSVDSVLKAESSGEQVEHPNAQGGSFFSGLKHFMNKLSRGVQKTGEVAQALAPAVGMFNPAAGATLGASGTLGSAFGGLGRQASGGALVGGGLRRMRRL